jgi:23S rRNA pseudouridine1911/1915/1917 synthase
LTEAPISSVSPSPGERLDLYLVRSAQAASRRHARELIAAGRVRVNERRCRKGFTLNPSDVVEVEKTSGSVALVPNSALPLHVLYQDDDILIVDKPGLMPCHPLRAGEAQTLMNAVAAHLPQAAEAGPNPLEGGLVHRLDNGTSGAVMVALTPAAFAFLRAALGNKQIIRSYLALAEGAVEHSFEFSAPIAHHPRNQRKMMVVHDPRRARSLKARPALTAVSPIQKAGRFTLLEVRPHTGRRHQIRVHLADAGFPLAGDELYGGPGLASLSPGRFFLHLAELQIPRLRAEQALPAVTAPLPQDLSNCLAQEKK